MSSVNVPSRARKGVRRERWGVIAWYRSYRGHGLARVEFEFRLVVRSKAARRVARAAA